MTNRQHTGRKQATQRHTTQIGAAIREAREFLGLSQGDLGQLLEQSKGAVSRKEAGIWSFSLHDVMQIADAFQIPLDELVRLKPGEAARNVHLVARRLRQLDPNVQIITRPHDEPPHPP